MEVDRRAIALAVAVTLLVTASASADPQFGPHDVQTIFYISKSDDRNRVDYGVRLDQTCRPIGSAPLYAYWRRFEPGQPRFGDLNTLDQRAYAIASQSVLVTEPGGSWLDLTLAPLPGEHVRILVQPDGSRCTARARLEIGGRPAHLERIHVQLAGPLAVDHVTIEGTDIASGRRVSETRRP